MKRDATPGCDKLMNCKIEIGSVIGLGKSLVEVDIDSFPLINTPFRGVICGSRISNCFKSFTTSTRAQNRTTET